jgi:hypothetical protein
MYENKPLHNQIKRIFSSPKIYPFLYNFHKHLFVALADGVAAVADGLGGGKNGIARGGFG